MAAPFSIDLDVRFRDIDSMGHVNNAVYATYLEQARVGYFESVLSLPLDAVETVLARVEIDFRRPVELGEPVTVTLSVPELGTSSIAMDYEVTVGDEVAATASSVQVVYDVEAGRARPIPDGWRERIAAFEGL